AVCAPHRSSHPPSSRHSGPERLPQERRAAEVASALDRPWLQRLRRKCSRAIASGVAATLGTSRTRARIGEASIGSLTCSEALDVIEQLVASRAGGFVVTPNIDHLVRLERDAALRQAYAAAQLTLVDGQPLVWASRLLGAPLPERIAGADL